MFHGLARCVCAHVGHGAVGRAPCLLSEGALSTPTRCIFFAFPLATGQRMMANMAKASDERASNVRAAEQGSRPRRGHRVDSNNAFVRAFADALRDILQDERRRAA